jgi:hypothetical protein
VVDEKGDICCCYAPPEWECVLYDGWYFGGGGGWLVIDWRTTNLYVRGTGADLDADVDADVDADLIVDADAASPL